MAFLFLLCAAQNGLDDDDEEEEEEEEPFKKGFLPPPTKPTSEARVPPPPETFIKWGGGAKGVRSGVSWKKSATDGGFPSLHCSPERGLQAFPLKGAPFQGHPRWKKLRTGIR